MLWYTTKKINAAFGRLKERRESVGDTGGVQISPEEEAKQLERDIASAEATGDLLTIVSLLAKTAQLTVEDYVKKTIGNVMFLYYAHLDTYHVMPRDLDDLVDGMLFMQAKQYIRKRALEEARENMQKR